MQSKTNPMRDLLQQQLGIDAFALDGNDTVLVESWQDRERRQAEPTVLTVDPDWPAEKPRRGRAIRAP